MSPHALIGQMSVGQVSVDQMSVGQVSVGQMGVGQVSRIRRNHQPLWLDRQPVWLIIVVCRYSYIDSTSLPYPGWQHRLYQSTLSWLTTCNNGPLLGSGWFGPGQSLWPGCHWRRLRGSGLCKRRWVKTLTEESQQKPYHIRKSPQRFHFHLIQFCIKVLPRLFHSLKFSENVFITDYWK